MEPLQTKDTLHITENTDPPVPAPSEPTEKPNDHVQLEQQPTEHTRDSEDTDHDGWCSCWDETSGAWYFYNTRTGETTWENPYSVGGGTGPTVQEEPSVHGYGGDGYAGATDPFEGLLDHVDRVKAVLDGPSNGGALPSSLSVPQLPWMGSYSSVGELGAAPNQDRYGAYSGVEDHLRSEGEDYTVRAHFNSRTGKFQPVERVIEDPRDRFSQTAKAERQCGVYFDYGSWAQMKGEKGGENGGKVMVKSRKEIQMLRQKKKEKKEQKRKAFFAD